MALDPITAVLVSDLDRDLRTQIVARREAMLREKRFLEEREDSGLSSVRDLGWTDERFEVLCGLNSFYQLVLGPLASSARERTGRAAEGAHLAPILFVGGSAGALHTRMISALEATYPINIVVGLHSGTWGLLGKGRILNRLAVLQQPNEPVGEPSAVAVEM